MTTNGAHPHDDPNWNVTRHPDDETLSAYLDHALDPGVQTNVAAHLTGCPRCRRELTELRAVVGLLHGLPEPAPPRSFALTPALVRAREPRVIRWLPHLRALTAVAAMLLIVSLAGDYFTRPGTFASETKPALAPAQDQVTAAAKPAAAARAEATKPAGAAATTAPAAGAKAVARTTAQATPAAASSESSAPAAARAPAPAAPSGAGAPAPASPSTPAPAGAPAAQGDSPTTNAPSEPAPTSATAPSATPAVPATATPPPRPEAAGETGALTQGAPAEAGAEPPPAAARLDWRILQTVLAILTAALLLTVLLAPRVIRPTRRSRS